MTSRWKCPNCGSTNVQVSYPTWYKETADYELTMVETDHEAQVLWWYCEDCTETEGGAPDENEQSTG